MGDLKFKPVRHDHPALLEKASRHRGFNEAYEALEVEYALAHEMLVARTRAGLTKAAVAGHPRSARTGRAPGLKREEARGWAANRRTARR